MHSDTNTYISLRSFAGDRKIAAIALLRHFSRRHGGPGSGLAECKHAVDGLQNGTRIVNLRVNECEHDFVLRAFTTAGFSTEAQNSPINVYIG